MTVNPMGCHVCVYILLIMQIILGTFKKIIIFIKYCSKLGNRFLIAYLLFVKNTRFSFGQIGFEWLPLIY